MNAAMANKVVMFAMNETSTTSVSSSGVFASPQAGWNCGT